MAFDGRDLEADHKSARSSGERRGITVKAGVGHRAARAVQCRPVRDGLLALLHARRQPPRFRASDGPHRRAVAAHHRDGKLRAVLEVPRAGRAAARLSPSLFSPGGCTADHSGGHGGSRRRGASAVQSQAHIMSSRSSRLLTLVPVSVSPASSGWSSPPLIAKRTRPADKAN